METRSPTGRDRRLPSHAVDAIRNGRNRSASLVAEYRVRWKRSRWTTDRVSEVIAGSRETAIALLRQLDDLEHGADGRVTWVALERRLVSPWTTDFVQDEPDATSTPIPVDQPIDTDNEPLIPEEGLTCTP